MQDKIIEYFMERTERDFEDVKRDIHHIRTTLDDLRGFKFLALGVVVGVSSLCSVVATIVTIYFKAH